MSHPPVVVVESGGVPRTQVAEGGSAPAFTVVESGARPITLADNSPPIALFNPDGTPYGSSFSPDSIASAALWLDATRSDLMVLETTSVTSIEDTIGGKVFAGVGATRPSLNATGGPDGGPCLVGDGTQYLEVATPGLPVDAEVAELWVLCSQDLPPETTGMRQVFCWGNAAAVSRGVGRDVVTGVNRAMVRTGTGGGAASRTYNGVTDGDFTTWRILRAIWDGTTHAINVGAESSGTDAAIPATAADRARLLSNAGSTPGQIWQGRVKHVIGFNALLSEGDASDLLDWFTEQLAP